MMLLMQENYEWAVKTTVSIVYLQLKFDEIQKDFSTQTVVFLAEVKLKKNKFLFNKIE